MFVIREVMSCKPGQVRPLMDKFKKLSGFLEKEGLQPIRLLTDVMGPRFWTLVVEVQTESIDGFMAIEKKLMADPTARAAMGGYHELMDHGTREIYRLEQ